MTLRLVLLLVIGLCVVQAAQAAVIHIGQRDNVYYGDLIDIRGIAGWADTLAWWEANHEPSQDPPDQFIGIINSTNCQKVLAGSCAIFNVTSNLHGGMYYQWYGSVEKAPVAVFYVIPKPRPGEANVTPAPTPTTVVPPVPVRVQPAAITDFLLAKGDPFTYATGGDCQVWLIGPSLTYLGDRVKNGTFRIPAVGLAPGDYSLVLQYPDANGVFEVFPAGDDMVDSAWKGVEGFWYAPLDPDSFQVNLMEMFQDAAHFHGSLVMKRALVQAQRADVDTIGQAENGTPLVRGTTNLRAGDTLTVIWDADRYVEPRDRAKFTVTVKAQGDDPGAYRVFRAALPVNLSTQPIGNHQIAVVTPDGSTTSVEFYVREAFVPFVPPIEVVHYINNSPFIPTPTPLIIEKEVPITVIQTVTIPVTPAYETVLQAQQEAADNAMARVVGGFVQIIIDFVLVLAIVTVGFFGWRYLKDVARRARS
jgi:hypothetical protein